MSIKPSQQNLDTYLGDTRTSEPPAQVSPRSPIKPKPYPYDPEFRLRGGWSNLMIDAAMPLFGLTMRLQTLNEHQDIAGLYRQVHNHVSAVLEELRQNDYEPAQVLAYSYGLCLYLDETVMRTPWGKSSCWSQQSLLSDFHQETWGGEKFFSVLSRMMMEPQRYQDVLEFMYLCLSMGLKGKYAIQPKGDEALQNIIVNLHRQIREMRGPTVEQWCDPLKNVAPRNYRISRQWPWWSPLVIAAVVMTGMYGYYSYRLHLITEEVLQSLEGILKL